MDGILPAHFAWFWAGCPLATRLRWLRSLGFNISCGFLGFWMAQLWLWLLVGYEHNVLEQGLMEIYGVWGRRLAGDFMVSLAGILRLSP